MTKEELGTLILNSERQLYSTAKTILINDQDCADAIQETIVKAFSKIGTLRNDKYAKTWLIRILINECYTLLRKSSKLVSLEGMSEMTEIETDQKTDSAADGAYNAYSQRSHRKVRSFLFQTSVKDVQNKYDKCI